MDFFSVRGICPIFSIFWLKSRWCLRSIFGWSSALNFDHNWNSMFSVQNGIFTGSLKIKNNVSQKYFIRDNKFYGKLGGITAY